MNLWWIFWTKLSVVCYIIEGYEHLFANFQFTVIVFLKSLYVLVHGKT